MLPYVVAFALSTGLVAIGGSAKNGSRAVRALCAIGAVMIVSALAGWRDYTVGGPDVMIYGNFRFQAMANAPDLGAAAQYAIDQKIESEFGYLFINYVVSRFSHDPHVFYFVLAALTSGIIMIAVMMTRNLGPAYLMWLTYLCTAYVEGYNLLRQSIALALAVLGVAYILKGRYRVALLVGLSGVIFHNSALIFIPLWAAATYVHSRKRGTTGAIVLVVLLCTLATLAAAPLLEVIGSSLANTRYESYLTDTSRSGRAFGVDALYRLVPIVAGFILLYAPRTSPEPFVRSGHEVRTATPRRGGRGPLLAQRTLDPTLVASPVSTTYDLQRIGLIALLALLLIDLLLLPIREISYPFYRIVAYFGYMRILAYGVMVGYARGSKGALTIGTIVFVVGYFVFIVILRNQGEYSSDILNAFFEHF